MSEFKAQLLSIIIVLTLFGFVQGFMDDIVNKSYNTIQNYYSTQVFDEIGVTDQ